MRYKLYGLVAVGLVIAVVAGVIGAYNQVFTPVVRATVLADRSGLLTAPGADVTVRGVTVGTVRSVGADGTGATLSVALDPDRAATIPADATAQIIAPTVFGAKFVDLVPPAGRVGPDTSTPIVDGTVIRRAGTPTEINPVFENLVSLMTSFDTAKLNSALGGFSTTLQGRGDRIGNLAQRLNAYLQGLQPSVPALADDLGRTGDVADVYADVAPDLLRTADNGAAISRTLVDQEPALQAFLLDLTGLADTTRGLLSDNERGLQDSLRTLRPVTALSAEYAPEFTCLFAGLNQVRPQIESVVGGSQPGIHLLSSVFPGTPGYRNPRDRPVTGAFDGPSCYGGPVPHQPGVATPRVQFKDGSAAEFQNPDTDRNGPPLVEQLFGDNAGLFPGRQGGAIGPGVLAGPPKSRGDG